MNSLLKSQSVVGLKSIRPIDVRSLRSSGPNETENDIQDKLAKAKLNDLSK